MSASLLLALALSAAAEDAQLTVEVVVGSPPPQVGSLYVKGNWLDKEFAQALTDDGDGSAPTGDGIWTTTLRGPPTRMISLDLIATTQSAPSQLLASTTEPVGDRDRITFALSNTSPPQATRVALARPARQLERFETATTVAGLGWFALVFGYVVWLVDGRFQRSEPRRRRRGDRT